MGRPPLRKKGPMTAAERQRRRRARLKREKLKLGMKAERKKRLLKKAETYIPIPPGITYWRPVTIETTNGPMQTTVPVTRPLASLPWQDLEDADVVALLERLLGQAKLRGIDVSAITPDTETTGLMRCEPWC